MTTEPTDYAAELERLADFSPIVRELLPNITILRQAAALIRRQAEVIEGHRALFLDLEFSAPPGHSDEGGCPSCGDYYRHAPDCRLKAALGA